jgi:hypothetical protein
MTRRMGQATNYRFVCFLEEDYVYTNINYVKTTLCQDTQSWTRGAEVTNS